MGSRSYLTPFMAMEQVINHVPGHLTANGLLVSAMYFPGLNDLPRLTLTPKLRQEGFLLFPAHVSVAMVMTLANHGLHAFFPISGKDAVHACLMNPNNRCNFIAALLIDCFEFQGQLTLLDMRRIGASLNGQNLRLFFFCENNSFYVHDLHLISTE